jgi:hypothetical protein
MRIRLPNGGTPERCAQAICDMIVCAFFQQAGIAINCEVTPLADGSAKITVSLPNGSVDWGNIDICLVDG